MMTVLFFMYKRISNHISFQIQDTHKIYSGRCIGYGV